MFAPFQLWCTLLSLCRGADASLPIARAAADVAAELKVPPCPPLPPLLKPQTPYNLERPMQVDLPSLLSIDNRETYENKHIASVFNESSKAL